MDRVFKAIAANKVDTLSYADDVALVAESEKVLQDSVTKWCDQLETFGMRMNKGKSEVMELSRLQKECIVYAEEQKLKEADTFKFGPSHEYKSYEAVKLPIQIEGKILFVWVSTVPANIPLLLGKDILKEWKCEKNFSTSTIIIGILNITIKLNESP